MATPILKSVPMEERRSRVRSGKLRIEERRSDTNEYGFQLFDCFNEKRHICFFQEILKRPIFGSKSFVSISLLHLFFRMGVPDDAFGYFQWTIRIKAKPLSWKSLIVLNARDEGNAQFSIKSCVVFLYLPSGISNSIDGDRYLNHL